MIEFIFMLTHNDATVPNALEVLTDVQDAGLRYIGFKDVGQSPEVLTELQAQWQSEAERNQVFPLVDEHPVQVIHPAMPITMRLQPAGDLIQRSREE